MRASFIDAQVIGKPFPPSGLGRQPRLLDSNSGWAPSHPLLTSAT
jgi:hypothetical protein